MGALLEHYGECHPGVHQAACNEVFRGASSADGAPGPLNEGDRDSHKNWSQEPNPEEDDDSEELGMARRSGFAGDQRTSLAVGV